MAFTKKESTAEPAAKKRQEEEKRQRGRVEKAAQSAQIRESQVKIGFREQSVEKMKPKTGEILTQAQSRIILIFLFDLQAKGISENYRTSFRSVCASNNSPC